MYATAQETSGRSRDGVVQPKTLSERTRQRRRWIRASGGILCRVTLEKILCWDTRQEGAVEYPRLAYEALEGSAPSSPSHPRSICVETWYKLCAVSLMVLAYETGKYGVIDRHGILPCPLLSRIPPLHARWSGAGSVLCTGVLDGHAPGKTALGYLDSEGLHNCKLH